ncbi:diacylglucosamine hydrolase [Paludibacter sp. 221]|uniref:epoxyqueuosine reductase QueH n=1 Tax=Paludibacter sp. 221 TaxID=2302939 RepID=UPI0013D7B49B|nr:epoxyqueuosine reductase QueH [Paludibacter sp. 221]NDV47415.1 diacylglucosamine hydrolase [Paludibacter sp. 221]
MQKKVLLHTCCAPCSAAIIEWLLNNGMEPVLFYYNPNIYPDNEYEIRKNECTKYVNKLNIKIIDADYNHKDWRKSISGLENEPERGKRCLQCFKLRLYETARYASELEIKLFATTLASSRWKDLKQISEAGMWAASQFQNTEFWDKNWRKEGLSERRKELLLQNGFYNQNYCGCEFSIKK